MLNVTLVFVTFVAGADSNEGNLHPIIPVSEYPESQVSVTPGVIEGLVTQSKLTLAAGPCGPTSPCGPTGPCVPWDPCGPADPATPSGPVSGKVGLPAGGDCVGEAMTEEIVKNMANMAIAPIIPPKTPCKV